VKARRRVRRRKLPEDDDDDMNLHNDTVDDDSSNHIFEQVEQTEQVKPYLGTSYLLLTFHHVSAAVLWRLCHQDSPGCIESDSTLG